MADCCDPRGCDQFFGPRYARSAARHYRKHGLDRTARRMVAFLERRGLEGATVLEMGGGVGEIQIEVLKRGAAHAVNLELVSAYEAEAQRLLRVLCDDANVVCGWGGGQLRPECNAITIASPST